MFGDIMEPTHLLFVLVVALLVLGPKRLPEVGRTLGSGIRDFRQAISGEMSHDHHEPEQVDTAATEQRHQPTDAPASAATEAAPASLATEPDPTPWYEETADPIDETSPVAGEPDSTAHAPATDPTPQSDVSATEPEHAVTQAAPPAPEPEHAVAQSASETRTEPSA